MPGKGRRLLCPRAVAFIRRNRRWRVPVADIAEMLGVGVSAVSYHSRGIFASAGRRAWAVDVARLRYAREGGDDVKSFRILGERYGVSAGTVRLYYRRCVPGGR